MKIPAGAITPEVRQVKKNHTAKNIAEFLVNTYRVSDMKVLIVDD
jgi:hypothetical protein